MSQGEFSIVIYSQGFEQIAGLGQQEDGAMILSRLCYFTEQWGLLRKDVLRKVRLSC